MLKAAEDTQAQEALPRELVSLRETTAELLQVVAVRHKERVVALVEELERQWKRANTLQLQLSAQGGHGDLLVLLADSLNAATEARGRALVFISPMTPQYS